MDRTFDLQDVSRCDNCEKALPELYCQLCNTNLCKTCAGEHLLDELKEHRVVPIKQKYYPVIPACPKHFAKLCELYCKNCDNPICVKCVASGEHDQHLKVDTFSLQTDLQTKLRILEENIYPKHKKALSDIQENKLRIKENSKNVKEKIKEHGNARHREIDIIIERMNSQIDTADSAQLDCLNKEEKELNSRISEISTIVIDLKNLEISRNVRKILNYQAKIVELSKLPYQYKVSLPTFHPTDSRGNLLYSFGHLSNIPITWKTTNELHDILFSPLPLCKLEKSMLNLSSGRILPYTNPTNPNHSDNDEDFDLYS